jgi:tetratricopeptide (TPR) repeat protein
MAQVTPPTVPPLSAEQRRAAAGQFERANQVIATGNYDYGIQLLLTCCKLDPCNLTYRRALRQTEKTKYKNNLRGSTFAFIKTSKAKAQIKVAARAHDHLRVMELGEDVLAANPWDTAVQVSMAHAAEQLGLIDMAVWILDHARQKDPNDVTVNRPMARLLEKRGNFAHAVALWAMVRKADPDDAEAKNKVNDLAASATIARGQYETAIAKHGADEETEPSPNVNGPKRPTDERERLRAQIDANPTNPTGYLQLAAALRRAGKLDEAGAVLESGLGPTGRHFSLATELAEVAIEPFRQNLALAVEKLRSQPNDVGLKRVRGELEKEINTRELELFRQKADHSPADKSHRYELGIRLYRAGRVDEAIRELQSVRSDPRWHWRALMHLGLCFENRKNWPLAGRSFEEALKNLPPAEEAARKELYFHLATGFAGAGDLTRAMEFGYELAHLDFAYRDIGKHLDEWQALQAQSS